MREIKFRAWDGEKMNYEVDMLSKWGAIKKGYSSTPWIKEASAGFSMQYTGLKDKNGKEIYEGDIVSAIDFEKTNYKIKFEDGCFIFTNGLRGHQLDYSTIQNLQAEVIGNIYENPELLNG